MDDHDLPDLSLIAAPMVNQSDLPFRLLTTKYGATLTYTQMLHPNRLLDDPEYLAFHLRDLAISQQLQQPVVVQLCGNDPDVVVNGAKKVVGECNGVDLNLGCPQSHAKDGHYGAYLLGQKDWPLVASIVSSLSQSLTVPVSAKIRLCSPSSQTLQFAHLLEAAGASWITLHARHVSVRRRRQGAAFLDEVAKLKTGSEAVPGVSIPVISNGNVRYWEDIPRNLEQTGADGVMVGETLLRNPCLFDKTGRIPDPILISLEYIDLCRQHPETVTLDQIQAHVKHLVEFQWYVRTLV
ncbi:FMN-linked oxidoreductase [Gloeophyllum trabeum ATCC 11539]|uniref:tRNA-dihydrouridine synthase n=1 Tax=Gloeophyllum trabeum (strain ATCC 11539 / FP-39264 / Madison 617) TaxID=670483 RepID=S7RDI8_GLOTA|nr:FMN-linked oxidoreductase [Gloeophyllum trabeum ATCC 11539]EPQ52285.1 FMN-linked oxidoreductase [Gloeophyllum trabeum ATCC 11539]